MPRYPGVLTAASGAGGVPYGLINFGDNNNSKYYSVTPGSPSILDLGSGAWAWGVWTRVSENGGINSQNVIGSGAFGATRSFNVYLIESGSGSNPNKFSLNIKDNAGVAASGQSATATGADNVLRLIVVQSTGTTVEMWHCAANGTASREINLAVNLGALQATAPWNFGRVSDGQDLQYYESEAGGFFKANTSLSQSQIEFIAGGSSPVTVLGANCAEYWPFKNQTLGTNETGVVASLVATYAEAAATGVPEFVQAGTGYSQTASQQSHTIAYTCAVAPGANRLLALCFGHKQAITSYDAVTYNSVAMTQAIKVHNSSNASAAIYYLLGANIPTDGASHNFVIDFSSTNSSVAWAMPIEYKNVKQGAPHRTGTQTGTGDGSISLTTVAVDSLLIDSFMTGSTSASSTPGANQNERYDIGTTAGTFACSDKLPAGHSGGTVAMAQDQTLTGSMAYVAAAWERAAGGVTAEPTTGALTATGLAPPIAGYIANPVVFDGTNDYLDRGAQYTNVSADTGKFTVAFSIKLVGSAADQHLLSGAIGTSANNWRYNIGRQTDNSIYVVAKNAAATTILNVQSSALTTGVWYAVLISIDLASTATRHLYINDTSDLATVTTYTTGETIDFTCSINRVGTFAQTVGNNRLNAEVADVWFDIDRYVDFSNVTNRRLFFNASNHPVHKGSTGSIPFSATPRVFLTGATATWHTNAGDGGGFTENGALTTGSGIP